MKLRIASPDEAIAARAQVGAHLRERAAADSDIAAAELIVSELVSNALKHGGGDGGASLTLHWEGEWAVLHVVSAGDPFDLPVGLPEEPGSGSGRGLFLVAKFSLGLAIEREDDANRVRAVLPVRNRKAARASPSQGAESGERGQSP
jgi:anti-sigma regulatory factor (Ser/Thr protein kinase)